MIIEPNTTSSTKININTGTFYDTIAKVVDDTNAKVVYDADRGIWIKTRSPEPVCAMFTPVRVWFTPGGYTTVEWDDGTKTTAHAENEETANQYCGFCACVVKKLYGSTTKAMKLMQSADERAKVPAKKRQEAKERIKKERQLKTERARDIREKRIQMLMDEMYVKREAERRVREADERSEFEQ